MILIIDKIINKLKRLYRAKVFLKQIKNRPVGINILGKIDVSCKNLKIGSNVTLYDNITFWGNGDIIIGNNVAIGRDTIIYSNNKVIIGDDVLIAAQNYIIDSNHGIKRDKLIRNQELNFGEGIIIGNDVWIGAGCKIINGAKINDGAVIGAMSLVNNEVDKYHVAVGIPAKSIKERR